jgi:hypothetical protein
VLLAALASAAHTFDPALAAPAEAFDDEFQSDLADDGRFNASAGTAPFAYDRQLPFQLRSAIGRVVHALAEPSLPVPGPVANVCFNPSLDSPGATWTLVRISVAPSSGNRETDRYIAGGPAVVPWQTGTLAATRRLLAQGYTAEDDEVDIDRTMYFLADDPLAARSQLGQQELGTYCPSGPACFEQARRSRFEPAIQDRTHLLDVGESFEVTYDRQFYNYVQAKRYPPEPDWQLINVVPHRVSTRFVGFEDVFSDAGTFRGACRFEIVDSDSVIPAILWITSSGDGLPVQASDWVLESGTLNGQPIR